MIEFSPFPEMKTNRLILRRMDEKDAGDLFEMRSDARMHEHTDTKPDEDPAETKVYIEKMNQGVDDNRWIIWAIEHKASKKVIGSISIWNINAEQTGGELGFGLNPEYQRQGLMKEALLRVVEYGFKVLKFDHLEAYTDEKNFNSIRLLERCDFVEVDRIEEAGMINPRVERMVVYRLGR